MAGGSMVQCLLAACGGGDDPVDERIVDDRVLKHYVYLSLSQKLPRIFWAQRPILRP